MKKISNIVYKKLKGKHVAYRHVLHILLHNITKVTKHNKWLIGEKCSHNKANDY
jgi:hypothetical protein